MGRRREPIALIQARGKKHLTKAEIKERSSQEIPPLDGEIVAPGYLSKKQAETFYKLADQLKRLKIMSETDVDTLARYVITNDLYIKSVKMLRKKEIQEDPNKLVAWTRLEDTYIKQLRGLANDLGLTISSRCKLIVPEANKEAPKTNKFKKFEKARA